MDKELERELAYVESLPGYEKKSHAYFKEPMIDRLVDTMIMLAGEVWAIRDRQILSEHLTAAGERVTPEALESLDPDDALLARLKAERAEFVRRIFSRLYDPEIMAPASEEMPVTGDTLAPRGTAGSVHPE